MKRLLLLGAVALAMGAMVRVLTAPAPAVAVAGKVVEETEAVEAGRPRWEEIWSRPAPNISAMSIAPDASIVTWVDRDGAVRCMDLQGRTLWRTSQQRGVNRVVAAPDGAIVAYSWLNPRRASVTLYPARKMGKSAVSCAVQGAVWSVACSPDGSRAVVGTGQRHVYVLPLSAKPNRPLQPIARWKAAGIPEYVAIADAEPMALLGTWQDSGVGAFALDGTVRWTHDEPEASRIYRVGLSRDGKTAVGVSSRGARGADARLHLWDAETGKPLWKNDLQGFNARALTSADGRYIAVAYVKREVYGSAENKERKLALYSRDGRKLWEKGGLFFSPELISLSADGRRLTVTDGVNTLYMLDAGGHIVSRLRLPVNPKSGVAPTILDAAATADGDYLLVKRGDGQISLLKTT